MEKELCENCGKEVPIANYQMHEAYCLRNIQPCSLCGMKISRSEEKEHIKEYHDEITCVNCGQKITRNEQESHLADECSQRTVSCEFCEILLPRERMTEHKEFCGSRTEICPRCSCRVLIKQLKSHEKSCEGASYCLVPCEFCTKMIAFDRLDTHQRQCMLEREGLQRNIPVLVENDDGSFSEIDENETGSVARHFSHTVPHEGKEEKTIFALPCEVCGELYPSDRLMQHQEKCGSENEKDLDEIVCTSGETELPEPHFRFSREQISPVGIPFDHLTAGRSLNGIFRNFLIQNTLGNFDDGVWQSAVHGRNHQPFMHY